MTKKTGVCKLTGTYGKFIKSHLIPQALTQPEIKGGIMKQIGEGKKAQKASTSWYDTEIVTQEGENILTEYDTAAIKQLRLQRLVWSSWKTSKLAEELYTPITDTHGFRNIKNLDNRAIRMFGLSLLWRACVSRRQGFEDIAIPGNDLETLKQIILKKTEDINYFYPISITQLSTKGEIHNQTPFQEELQLLEVSEITGKISYPIIRFYFDGLIMHIRKTTDEDSTKGCEKLFLNMDNELILPTIAYEVSFQKMNLEAVKSTHLFELKNDLLKYK